MLNLEDFIKGFYEIFPELKDQSPPWSIPERIHHIIEALLPNLSSEYIIKDRIAIHNSALIEPNVMLKPPVFIGRKCFIGANAYLRGGVYLGESTSIGPGCEIKSSIITGNSSLAHFNFIGDSMIGHHVNFEAGAITANHYNERENKEIFARLGSEIINTKVMKFGSVIGDHSKIGANAVLSPGTILKPGSVVKRLSLIDQVSDYM